MAQETLPDRLLGALTGAYSDNTLRAYRSDFRVFTAWCSGAGLSALPAAPETVAGFLTSGSSRIAVETLRRRIAAIRKFHRLAGHIDPTLDERVGLALRREKRMRPGRPAQALGLTSDRLGKLLATCGDDLAGKRDRALLMVGYDLLCRCSELVALTVEDLRSVADAETILVRRSKSDPFGSGREGALSPQTALALREWLKASAITEGPLFRRLDGDGIGGRPLHPHTIGRILKRRAKAAGYDGVIVARLSGHSMRVGAAQDMMTAGLGLLAIMRSGGWRSTSVVARYVENADIVRTARRRYQVLDGLDMGSRLPGRILDGVDTGALCRDVDAA